MYFGWNICGYDGFVDVYGWKVVFRFVLVLVGEVGRFGGEEEGWEDVCVVFERYEDLFWDVVGFFYLLLFVLWFDLIVWVSFVWVEMYLFMVVIV